MRLARVGKIPTTAVRRLISLLSRSWGLVLRIWRRWASGEREVDEQIGLRLEEQAGDGRKADREPVGHPAQLLGRGMLVGLLEDAPDRRGDHACGTARDEILWRCG
jgi:hypothetical protein